MILWCHMTPAKEKLGEEPGGHQANCKNSGDIVSVIILTGLDFNISTDTTSPYRQVLRLIIFSILYFGANENVWDTSLKVTD